MIGDPKDTKVDWQKIVDSYNKQKYVNMNYTSSNEYESINDANQVIVKKDNSVYANTFYIRMLLSKGDEVYISRSAYRVKPMKYIPNTPLMCVKLIKRDKWWKFWEPKYKGAIYRMMEDY